jgi:hypothetical protein
LQHFAKVGRRGGRRGGRRERGEGRERGRREQRKRTINTFFFPLPLFFPLQNVNDTVCASTQDDYRRGKTGGTYAKVTVFPRRRQKESEEEGEGRKRKRKRKNKRRRQREWRTERKWKLCAFELYFLIV